MAAPVISGVYSSASISWQASPVGQASVGTCLIPNIYGVPITLSGPSIVGPNFLDFSFPAGQVPVTLQPGQSALISVQFAPFALGLRTATLSLITSIGPIVSVQLLGTAANTAIAEAFPSDLNFPNTKVGLSTTFANMQIVNLFNAAVTVTAIGLTAGTDFFLVGAPIPPFVILQGGSSAVFSVQFSPTVTGARNDTLNVTVAGNVATSHLGGVGSTLQSAFNLTGALQGSLFAFPGGGLPLILLSDPNDLNTEEVGSFTKLHDYQIPNLEKQTMRVRGHYEDLGAANLIISARSRRVDKPDETSSVTVPIGVSGDGWIREFTGETEITGELVQLSFSRAKGTSSTLASDNFNRANENPLVSPPWSAIVSAPPLQLVSNTAVPSPVGATNIFSVSRYDGGIVWPPNQSSAAIITAGIAFSGNLAVMIRTDAAGNGYVAWIDFTQGAGSYVGPGSSCEIDLATMVNGQWGAFSPTLPFKLNAGVAPCLVGDELKIQAIGNRISLLYNNVERLSVIDTTYTSGKPALGIFRSNAFNAPDIAWDNWAGGGASGGGPISIVDYYPEFEPKGKVTGGT